LSLSWIFFVSSHQNDVTRIINLHNSKITLQSVRIIFIGWKLATNLSLFIIPVTSAVPVQALYLGLLIYPSPSGGWCVGGCWFSLVPLQQLVPPLPVLLLVKVAEVSKISHFQQALHKLFHMLLCRESCIWTLLLLSLEFSFRLSPPWVLVSILFVALVACPVCASTSMLHKSFHFMFLYPDVGIFWIDLRQAPLVFCFSL